MNMKVTVRSKILTDLYRGKNGMKCYQPITKMERDEKGDLATDCHSVLARCRKHFSQLLYLHGVNDVRHTEMHTVEPPVWAG